jgi:hypothetical protein
MVMYRIVLTDEYLEEAQRLSLAQHTTLRLMYQTEWVWWLPRVIFAAALVFLLVEKLTQAAVVTGAFLVLTFIGPFHSRRTLAKARKRTRAKGSTTTITMDENGVDIDGALGHSHLKWAAMLPPVIRADGVLLKFSRLGGTWLPDTALVEGSANEARQLLASKVQVAGAG